MVIKHSAQHDRITAAINEAKHKVAVDIRLVVVPSSGHYRIFAMLHALIAAMIAGFVATVAQPYVTPVRLDAASLLFLQFVIALIALACLQSRWLRHELVPNAALRKSAWRNARLTYSHLKLKAAHDEPVVLLFCSKLERYVEILTEDRVLANVPAATWERIVADFKPHMKDKRDADAYIHLIERAVEALLPIYAVK